MKVNLNPVSLSQLLVYFPEKKKLRPAYSFCLLLLTLCKFADPKDICTFVFRWPYKWNWHRTYKWNFTDHMNKSYKNHKNIYFKHQLIYIWIVEHIYKKSENIFKFRAYIYESWNIYISHENIYFMLQPI